MSAVAWIEAASPDAPERLVARVRDILAGNPAWAALPVPEALVEAADVLLALVLAEGDGPARDRALDLLAADACVTWAFEAAADDPSALAARARDTMARLAKAVA